eukprot:75819-Pleurochrysis_carterae.AAC.1
MTDFRAVPYTGMSETLGWYAWIPPIRSAWRREMRGGNIYGKGRLPESEHGPQHDTGGTRHARRSINGGQN